MTYHNVGGGVGGHHAPVEYSYGPPPEALFASSGPSDYYRRTDYVNNNNVQPSNTWSVNNNQQASSSWDASNLWDSAQLAYRGYFLGDEQRVSRSAHPVTESIIGHEYKSQIQHHQMQFPQNQIYQHQPELQAQQYNHHQQPPFQQQQHYQQLHQLHQQGLQHHQQQQPELQIIHQTSPVQFIQNTDNHLHPMQTSQTINSHQMLPVPQPLASPLGPMIQPSDETVVRAQLNFQPQILTPKPPPAGTTVPVTYDPFYSPILQRMDNVFVQLGFNEEACRERLVCSMYKNPSKYTPHSNLISAELSR